MAEPWPPSPCSPSFPPVMYLQHRRRKTARLYPLPSYGTPGRNKRRRGGSASRHSTPYPLPPSAYSAALTILASLSLQGKKVEKREERRAGRKKVDGVSLLSSSSFFAKPSKQKEGGKGLLEAGLARRGRLITVVDCTRHTQNEGNNLFKEKI